MYFRVTCPILVLHAEDDHVIPIDLGRKLVNSAKTANRKVTLIEFEAKREFLHKYIHRAEELPAIIKFKLLFYFEIYLYKKF